MSIQLRTNKYDAIIDEVKKLLSEYFRGDEVPVSDAKSFTEKFYKHHEPVFFIDTNSVKTSFTKDWEMILWRKYTTTKWMI